VTAQSTAQSTDTRAPAMGRSNNPATDQKTWYQCPVYKYPKRLDKYLIFRVSLNPQSKDDKGALPNGMKQTVNWKLKGVALLATKE